MKNDKAILLRDLTAGADLVLEGSEGATQAVSFRLAPDLFARITRAIPLVIDYRVSLPPGAPLPELMVELNHRIIGKLAVPKPAQGPMPNTPGSLYTRANCQATTSCVCMLTSVPTGEVVSCRAQCFPVS